MFGIGVAIVAYCIVSFAGAAIISEGVRARYTPLVVTHGLLVLAWMVLVPVQAWLASSKSLGVHRKLGKISPLLVTAMLAVGLPVMVLVFYEFGSTGLLFANLAIFAQFLLFYVTGIFAAKRHRVDWHKRLMLFATLSMLGPAHGRFVRLFGFGDEAGGLLGPVFIIAIPLIYDKVSEGRVRKPTVVLISIAMLLFILTAAIVIGVIGI